MCYHTGEGEDMNTFTIAVHVPDDLRDLGYSDDELRRDLPAFLVIKRFRQGAISSGKAASLLKLSRRQFLDLLDAEGVPLYDPSDSELEAEFRTLGIAK
jgi:predicted HTH domain antitoxin